MDAVAWVLGLAAVAIALFAVLPLRRVSSYVRAGFAVSRAAGLASSGISAMFLVCAGTVGVRDAPLALPFLLFAALSVAPILLSSRYLRLSRLARASKLEPSGDGFRALRDDAELRLDLLPDSNAPNAPIVPTFTVLGAPLGLHLSLPSPEGVRCGGLRASASGDPLLLAAALMPDVRARLEALGEAGTVTLVEGELRFAPTEARAWEKSPEEALIGLVRALSVPESERAGLALATLADRRSCPELRRLALRGLLATDRAEAAARVVLADRRSLALQPEAAGWFVDRGRADEPLPTGTGTAGERFTEALTALAGSREAKEWHQAIDLLAVPRGHPRAALVRAVLPALRETPSYHVRVAALRARARLDGTAALPELYAATRGGWQEQRAVACREIGALVPAGDPTACATMVDLVERQETADATFVAAAEVLGRIGTVAHVEALRRVQTGWIGEEKREALEQAIGAIQARLGAVAAGRVAVVDGGGAVAIVESGTVAIADDARLAARVPKQRA